MSETFSASGRCMRGSRDPWPDSRLFMPEVSDQTLCDTLVVVLWQTSTMCRTVRCITPCMAWGPAAFSCYPNAPDGAYRVHSDTRAHCSCTPGNKSVRYTRSDKAIPSSLPSDRSSHLPLAPTDQASLDTSITQPHRITLITSLLAP